MQDYFVEVEADNLLEVDKFAEAEYKNGFKSITDAEFADMTRFGPDAKFSHKILNGNGA